MPKEGTASIEKRASLIYFLEKPSFSFPYLGLFMSIRGSPNSEFLNTVSNLQEKIATGEAVVTIVGMGYVGLPLALNFAKAGLQTFGLDIDTAKVETLNRGESYIEHIDANRIAAVR